jgi:SAM-dependent methyltransferase
MNLRLSRLFRGLMFNSPFRKYVFPKYPYNFTPQQLCFLCECIEQTRYVEGNIAEIGCFTGWTTIFLNKYMAAANIPKKYFAIDTFSGFVDKDIDFEISFRNKKKELYGGFQANRQKWFDGTMKQNNISTVSTIKTDVNNFDLTTLGPLSFVLLDVDLYRPMKKAIPELYRVLTPGGIIVLDDCDPEDMKWDGSDQAYKEFVKENNLKPEIIHGRLGILRKQN